MPGGLIHLNSLRLQFFILTVSLEFSACLCCVLCATSVSKTILGSLPYFYFSCHKPSHLFLLLFEAKNNKQDVLKRVTEMYKGSYFGGSPFICIPFSCAVWWVHLNKIKLGVVKITFWCDLLCCPKTVKPWWKTMLSLLVTLPLTKTQYPSTKHRIPLYVSS